MLRTTRGQLNENVVISFCCSEVWAVMMPQMQFGLIKFKIKITCILNVTFNTLVTARHFRNILLEVNHGAVFVEGTPRTVHTGQRPKLTLLLIVLGPAFVCGVFGR